MVKVKSSEITSEHTYVSRRQLMVGIGAALAGGILLGGCAEQEGEPAASPTPGTGSPTASPSSGAAGPTATPTEAVALPADELTSLEAITSYNNFYEFGFDKEGVADAAKDFQTSPWTVEVTGFANKPKTFGIEDLLKLDQEERIYRMRCVEAWSMVIPWNGFSLAKLLSLVDPTSQAKYVRFETLLDPEQMPGQRTAGFEWPYVEGLRMDEAMHNLTILATGLYGEPLLPQNGAPLRLVVPWKYGFKCIKSIVRIELVEAMPVTFWMASGPSEYGFWANVNPAVPHPRWSQATERRIGESGRRETLFMNGYADEVASLYPDRESKEWYY